MIHVPGIKRSPDGSRGQLHDPVARAVAAGLAASPKRLPPWLFYDDEGSALFEAITELPEYYPTRTEREIFERSGDEIVVAALGAAEDATFVELGAGTATKTQVLLRAAVRLRGAAAYVPVDVSAAALEAARARLAVEEPAVSVDPWAITHDEALPRLRALPGRRVVLFIGSSIGNYEGDEAIELLAGVRRALGRRDVLVLGTDLRKDPAVLVPAYDDASGVTAAFNLNVLVRINRELGGNFDLDAFRHVALWNDERSRMEMHLESTRDQVVAIDALGARVRLRRGERIHTESSVKYDDAMVDALLGAAGFRRERTFLDDGARFAVHLARPTS
jgi:dimethylhistidine N-methyltransferase